VPSLLDFLAEAPLFAALPAASRARLAARAETIRVRAGAWLFRAGDEGDRLFVVRSGRLEVVLEGDPAVVLRGLRQGHVVGELALLTSAPRSASVRAVRDSELVSVGRDDVDALLAEDPAFASGIIRSLSERLQDTAPPGGRRPVRPAALAVVALRDGLPAERVAGAVAEELAGHASTVLLAPTEPWGEALDAAERAHAHVVLAAARPPGDPWTDFCLRQADRALLLAEPADAPPPVARGAVRGRDLGLIGRGVPGDWLESVAPRAVHPLGEPAAIARSARRLGGHAVGVVLSGGGARALCHVGVLAGLQEAGVTLDRVGGCSMGAFVGAMFALGGDPDAIADRCREELVRRKPLSDWTVPRVSLIRARRAMRMLERVFGDARVETATRACFCVSADLVEAELVVHRTGLVRSAVGASMSLPGLLPPMPEGGRLLVDGGVLDNLPVLEMAAEHEGPVIAVDAMGRRPLGRPDRLPHLVDTLARSTVLGSWRELRAKRAVADLVVEPDAGDVGLLEFDALDRLVAAGRRDALTAVAASRLAAPA